MYTVYIIKSLFFHYIILFLDIIKEVIDQQSTLYDNVNIVANFFKYEQVSLKRDLYTVFSFTSVQQPPYKGRITGTLHGDDDNAGDTICTFLQSVF